PGPTSGRARRSDANPRRHGSAPAAGGPGPPHHDCTSWRDYQGDQGYSPGRARQSGDYESHHVRPRASANGRGETGGAGSRGAGVPAAVSAVGACTRRSLLKGGALALVGLGSVPRFLVRAAGAEAVGTRPTRPRILIAVFQRGAVDGLSMIVPHA